MEAAGNPLGMRERFAKSLVDETLQDTPITVIQGARQVGKSTLARAVTNERPSLMLSLDTAAVYQAAKADPDAFVRQTNDLLVIDEVQRVPELVLAMKDAVEENRRPGRFLITGSADILELPGTQESLAVRAETVLLYGLSRGELEGHQEDFVDRVIAGDSQALRGSRPGASSSDRATLANLRSSSPSSRPPAAGVSIRPHQRLGTRPTAALSSSWGAPACAWRRS
jgi:uncharacterized protein